MPAEVVATPTISQVYGAFDESSHRVFRAAMAKSCGGVLRVADLAAALWELDADDVADLVPEGWRPSEPTRGSQERSRLTPMSNEPAVRRWLFEAYQVALEQPGDSRAAVVSPRILWAAAFVQRIVPCSRSITAMCERLRIACTPRLLALVGATHVATNAVSRDESRQSTSTLGPELDRIVNAWLGLQSLPLGDERVALRTRLATDVNRLEAAS